MIDWLEKLSPVSPPFSCGWRMITAGVAEEMLRFNLKNRRHRETLSDRYARDMTAGNWHVNADPIVFGTDGNLYNGQHTLNAIIKSGRQQLKMVVQGFPLNAIPAMDRGAVRSVFDVLKMQGFDVPKGVQGICNAWVLLTKKRAITLSADEVIDLYCRNLEAFSFAMSLPSSPEVSNSVAYFAALALAWHHESPLDIMRFHEIYRVSITTFESTETAAVALRNLARSNPPTTNNSKLRYGFMVKTAAAVRAFCEGRPLKIIKQPGDLPYSIPEDKR